jgi:hypothetical protein
MNDVVPDPMGRHQSGVIDLTRSGCALSRAEQRATDEGRRSTSQWSHGRVLLGARASGSTDGGKRSSSRVHTPTDGAACMSQQGEAA